MKNQKKLKKYLFLMTAIGISLFTSLSKVQAAPTTAPESGGGAAAVEPAAPAETAAGAEAPAGGGKSKVLRFDSLTITGDAAKPQVFYLLNRKKILIRHEPEKRDLLENIEKSVEGRPF